MGVTADELNRAIRTLKTDLTKILTDLVTEMESHIMAEIDTQLTDYGNQVTAFLTEAGAEWSAQLTDLQNKLNAALANSGTGINSIADLSPEAQAALDAARASAESMADRVPGSPAQEEPSTQTDQPKHAQEQ